MDGGARDLHAVLEGVGHRVPPERRQQRRVAVEDPAPVGVVDRFVEDRPEPGHRDEVDPGRAGRRRPARCRRPGRSPDRSGALDGGGDAVAGGDVERPARAVDQDHLDGIPAGRSRRGCCPTRCQHPDTHVRRTYQRPSIARTGATCGSVRAPSTGAQLTKERWTQQIHNGRQGDRRFHHRLPHLHVPPVVRDRGTSTTSRTSGPDYFLTGWLPLLLAIFMVAQSASRGSRPTRSCPICPCRGARCT